ncbi:MAG: hypothetical protein ABIY55_27380 [Kofleriaceae bacterium]
MEDTDEAPDITTTARIGLNALSPGALWASQLTVGTLTAAHATAMGSNTYARAVLAYTVGCALSSTQSITFTVGSTQYTDPGAFGVATDWTTRALTATEAAWVSACVISRVNLTSTSVSISARGDNVGYATTSTELTDYKIQEGAFWGNLFTDQGSLAFYGCNGVDQAANDTYGDLPLRQCAQSDGTSSGNSPCGFPYAGLCSAVCSTASPYSGCAYAGGATHAEVVTTYLYGTPQ